MAKIAPCRGDVSIKMSPSNPTSRECLCRRFRSQQQLCTSAVLCPACVDKALSSHVQRHRQALVEKNEARERCADRLQKLVPKDNISELSVESQRLREKLSKLRQKCGALAVRVASQVVDNDERRALQEGPTLPRQQLQRLNQSLCDPLNGALTNAILQTTEQVKVSRFRWACHAFFMHRLDVGSENHAPSSQRRGERRPRGIGKIGGLPLPHAGPELYGVLPPQELQSALRLVASLTCVVARCLGIILPHPILLRPRGNQNNGSDITDTVNTLNDTSRERTEHKEHVVGSSSTSSLKALMNTTTTWGRSAKQALARATGALEEEHMAPTSMEPSLVKRRLRHATCVILGEDSSSTSLYSLSHETLSDDHFAIGLQLLQNNVVALCIRAGVPVAALWPAEALLLNLHALWQYCQDQKSQEAL